MINKAICVISKTHKKCKEFSNTLKELWGEPMMNGVGITTYDDICNPNTSIIMEKYNISSLPSLILVDEKEDEICKISGNVDIATLNDIIGDIMNGKYNWSLR